MSDKRCRVCGDELERADYGGGSVWSCGTHGVRDWQFGEGAHFAALGHLPGPAPSARAPGVPTQAPPAAADPRHRPGPAAPSGGA